MTTYILRELSSGNLLLNKIINFKQIGRIIGRIQNNNAYIYNIDVSLQNRRLKHGSDILNVYETLIKNNYNVNTINVSAWENISNPSSVKEFYISNGYKINLNQSPKYYDDKLNIFEINQFFKKL